MCVFVLNPGFSWFWFAYDVQSCFCRNCKDLLITQFYFDYLTDPKDSKLRKIDDSFLLGSILVATRYNYFTKVRLLFVSPYFSTSNSESKERKIVCWSAVVIECCSVQPLA